MEATAVDGIGEALFILLVEFDERVGAVYAIDRKPEHDFLGMVGIRRLVVDLEIGSPRFLVARVRVAAVVTGMPGIVR